LCHINYFSFTKQIKFDHHWCEIMLQQLNVACDSCESTLLLKRKADFLSRSYDISIGLRPRSHYVERGNNSLQAKEHDVLIVSLCKCKFVDHNSWFRLMIIQESRADSDGDICPSLATDSTSWINFQNDNSFALSASSLMDVPHEYIIYVQCVAFQRILCSSLSVSCSVETIWVAIRKCDTRSCPILSTSTIRRRIAVHSFIHDTDESFPIFIRWILIKTGHSGGQLRYLTVSLHTDYTGHHTNASYGDSVQSVWPKHCKQTASCQ